MSAGRRDFDGDPGHFARSFRASLVFMALMCCVTRSLPAFAAEIQCKPKYAGFECLSTVDPVGDLTQFGLVAPNQHDHEKGVGLILTAIRTTQEGAGSWFTGVGLLGVSMLDVDVNVALGYEALFLTGAKGTSALHAASSNPHPLGLAVMDDKIAPTPSVIARRQIGLHLLSRQMVTRFSLGRTGELGGTSYDPDPARRETTTLRYAIGEGVKIYSELGRYGFEDVTLRDALGIAAALVAYDSGKWPASDIAGLTGGKPAAAYQGALAEAMKDVRKGRSLTMALTDPMQAIDLLTEDNMIFPPSTESKAALVKIVEVDLKNARRPSNLTRDSK